MKKITSIKSISDNKFSLLIDGEKHIIYGDVLLEYNILRPMEINSDTYINLINTNNYRIAYYKVINFINAKMRTEKEIRNKLYTLKVSKDNSNKIIKELYLKNYINDDLYVRSFVNDQINLTLNGPHKIYYELKRNDFTDELINKYLDFKNDIWKERTKKLIDKKVKANHKLSRLKLLQKIKNDLKNLGYEEWMYKSYLDEVYISDENQYQKDYEKYHIKLSKKYTGEKLEVMIKRKMYSLGYNVNDQ